MKLSTILYSTIAIIFAPTAYVIGVYYHQGWLNGYGVDSSHFQQSINDTYVDAFNFLYANTVEMVIWIINTISKIISHISMITFIVTLFIFGLSEFLKKLSKTDFNLNSYKIWLTKLVNSYEIKITAALAYSLSPVFTFLYFIFLFMLLLCMLPYWAYNKGFDSSFKDVARFNKVGCTAKATANFSSCITYSSGNTKLTGLLITRNDTDIAIYDGFKTHIIKLSGDYDIVRLTEKKPI